ncbi:MAG: pyruvate dehydrogenase (acetyl-transferring), homodimeric type [bacterium]
MSNLHDEDAPLREETREWVEALEYIFDEQGAERVRDLLNALVERAHRNGVQMPFTANTPYVNTIPSNEEPPYPGDREIERRIKSIVRWNALSMVVKANRLWPGIGGHISTYQSAATLYEVAYNHVFCGPKDGHRGDLVFFQGHASPGIYARAYVEGVLDARHMHNFRRELADGGGLSSYPHPWLMPGFWQFPTVSMGLGPIMAIYQARFCHYLRDRGLIDAHLPKVWAFLGDGECDEPETLGAITLASRENLDNLVFVINCNLQRLDGPVRGNGKIIQELEAAFRGAGWNVIKVIWGSNWDPLLARDKHGLLMKRMGEAVDGDYQKYSAANGAYTRRHFFGKYPELLDMVKDMTDEQIMALRRGGHDPQKVYSAFKAAMEHKGQPTVILVKTIKGYGMGEAGEGRNISHQQKKLSEDELREFRNRFQIPVPDDEVDDLPFYRPPDGSPEAEYIKARRKELGGFLPHRNAKAAPITMPERDYFAQFYGGSGGREVSTTMAFVQIFLRIIGNKDFGKYVTPIIPDEARTFGMEALFRQYGIYSHVGQTYEPVDREQLLYYLEKTDGQILEEGITEAGSMSSFIAAGTAYANHGITMMPFFIYYSMFGFQRIGDLVWASADMRTRGFLLGATAGRTTLNGEGLQHQDGHSHLLASAVPTIRCYHPAFAYEIALIIQDGMKRMFESQEDLMYYITLGNENYVQPAMPEGVEEGVLQGLYKYKSGKKELKIKAHILADFSAINVALKAQKILAAQYGVSADVWSATSYKQLRADALETGRWNMLHPTAEKKKKSHLENVLENEEGPFVAVSDSMRMVPDQIAKWVPGGLLSLGTDGFGRSDTRENLRDFFEISPEHVIVAVLSQLARNDVIKSAAVKRAIDELGIDSDREFPLHK